MSAPGVTFFCINGHRVYESPHGCWLSKEDSEQLSCPYCSSTEVKPVLEWGYDDYDGWKDEVPLSPIKSELRMVSVPIYDVSKLFKGKK